MGLNRESRHEWVMKICAALIAAALTAATPALAEITELAAVQSGETAKVLIRFDVQPQTAAARVNGDTVVLSVEGADATAQTVTPPAGSPVTAAAFAADGSMTLRLSQAPSAAQADLFKNAVVLTIETDAAAAQAGEEPEAEDGPLTLTMEPPGSEGADAEPAAGDTPPEEVTDSATGNEPANEPEAATEAPASSGERVSDELPDVNLSDGAAAMFSARLSPAACAKANKDVAADPWAVQAVKRLAACRARQGEAQQAQELYERILTFDPYEAEAVAGLGALAQDRGQSALAREKYEEALGMNPGDGLAALIRQLMAEL